MCGICGIVGENMPDNPKEMRDTLSHRGPDGAGEYQSHNVYLGHRRLSIVDIETGGQPISSEDGTVILSYNGEIYNHLKLRNELKQKGHKFKTHSDGEVIIHLYEDLGERAISRLRGMFSISLWDGKKELLLLARDRLGIKPLYFSKVDGSLIFASEIKAILKHLGHTPPINWEAFESLLTLRYIPSPMTIFSGIEKLQPGTILTYQKGISKISTYWDPFNIHTEEDNLDKIVSEIYKKFDESVFLRLMGDVDVGLYLSGGVDSASILSSMMKHSDGRVKSFSAGFSEKKYDESALAAATAEHFDSVNNSVKSIDVTPSMLRKIIWNLEEPLGDATLIPTYQLAEFTSGFLKVVLSGEGADELFLGYPKYSFLRLMERFRGGMTARIFGKFSGIFGRNTNLKRFRDYMTTTGSFSEAYLNLTSVFSTDEKERLLTPRVYKRIQNVPSTQHKLEEFFRQRDSEDPLHSLSLWDLKYWLPDDLLLKNDKMNMAHGIEARLPFLDHEFVEYILGLPSNLKTKVGKNKALFRKAMANHLPKSIVKRKKRGFTVPIESLYESQKKYFDEHLFEENRIREQGIFNYEFIQDLKSSDLSNRYLRRQFWTLASFQIWWDVFVKEDSQNVVSEFNDWIPELVLV